MPGKVSDDRKPEVTSVGYATCGSSLGWLHLCGLGLVVAVLALFSGSLIAAAVATTGAGLAFGIVANTLVR